MAAGAVWVPASAEVPRRRSQPVLAAWVVRVWEPQPPTGSEALEWILLCSVPTGTLADIRQRRDWYSSRWVVEVYHDIEKNGCREEARRFETAARLAVCLAVLSIVAVRVLQLRRALATGPEAPAAQVASAAEVTLIRRLSQHEDGAFTVRAFVRGVARLGGFLGRRRDGDPGVRAVWRGYQRLQDMVAAVALLAAPPDTG